eukprot:scaffold14500_cov20-Tisochrysis_lutea.AAC.2
MLARPRTPVALGSLKGSLGLGRSDRLSRSLYKMQVMVLTPTNCDGCEAEGACGQKCQQTAGSESTCRCVKGLGADTRVCACPIMAWGYMKEANHAHTQVAVHGHTQ